MNNIYKQNIHIEPKKGWLNDPNGLIYFKGFYHIFYQYSYEVNGGLKYWYHEKSKDLIHFEDLGIFLEPVDSFDKDGVYSGSCNIENDEMVFYYTGNVKHKGDFDYIHQGREHNTIRYTEKDGKKIILKNSDYINMSNHVRDPKIYNFNNKNYIVLGGRDKNDKGCLLIFDNNNLVNTIYYKKELGYMWECPDLFDLKNRKVLLFSPQGIQFTEKYFDNKYQVGYSFLSKEIDKEQIIDNFKLFDYGHDFYATQTFLDEENRRVFFAWMYVPDSDYTNDTIKFGYQNCLSIPRILDIKDDKLIQKIHPSILSLLSDNITEKTFNNSTWYFKTNNDFSIKIDELIISYKNNILNIDIEKVGCGRKNRNFELNINDIEIVFDSSSFELFANDGSFTFSSRFYPKNHNVIIECKDYIAKKLNSIKR